MGQAPARTPVGPPWKWSFPRDAHRLSTTLPANPDVAATWVRVKVSGFGCFADGTRLTLPPEQAAALSGQGFAVLA